MENILRMLKLTNAPTVPMGDDELNAEADEPPDDKLPELRNPFKKETSYRHFSLPSMVRRESLLTRAIQAENDSTPNSPTSSRMSEISRGLSTTSSHSFASTAELTSDAESPARSASPSPPPPAHRLTFAPSAKPTLPTKVVIAPLTKDDKPTVAETGEAAIEKSLGRKRCIMFACKDAAPEAKIAVEPKPKVLEPPKSEQPAPRKCRISFACPTKPIPEVKEPSDSKTISPRQRSPAQATVKAQSSTTLSPPIDKDTPSHTRDTTPTRPKSSLSPQQSFHEFAGSHDENEAWVEKASELHRPKLTINDCLKKENAIRKLGKEAEEEAEEEEREQEEMDVEVEDDDAEDDFAPSDEESHSDGGNESDDEGGFADSDSESDAGSDYQFWAPSTTTTTATSTENLTHFSVRQKSRSRASSTSSAQSVDFAESQRRQGQRIKAAKAIRMRPGTPELPDSTDFVCGTLDEDRPLEAAYISCREQKRRQRHIPIPQDIDPSFPTTDPEDQEDDEEEEDQIAESSDQVWMKGKLEGIDEEPRGRRNSAFRVSPLNTPAPETAAVRPPARPAVVHRSTLRSPPPKLHKAKSPPPPALARRLFDNAPRRLRSPPPNGRLRSPRGSPTNMKPAPFGITINHLAQRPNAIKTSSLPHTPNPFFKNWRNGRQPVTRITNMTTASDIQSPPSDTHIRGPVDIVIGLEKKRQKRKEKYWRQHCRKVAKQEAGKRPPPGRGVERMKELGLECAERTRGYGLGQPAQLVLSL